MNNDDVILELWVPGEPVPQGSMQAFVPLHPKTKQPYRRDGGGVVVNVKASNEKVLKPWRAKIAELAAGAWSDEPLTDVSLMVEADFFLKRRENDWGTGRNAAMLKPHAEAAPAQDPDVDKLLRAVLDGLTGVVWHDDNLVTLAVAEKHYAVPSERGDGQGVALKVLRREAQVAEQLPLERQRRVAPGESQLALA